jgi:hypothetical protein
MVLIASRYPAGARFMVFVVGFPAIALCLLQFVLDWRDIRSERLAVPAAAADAPHAPAGADFAALGNEAFTPELMRKDAVVWAYFLALIGGILLFGFYITVPIFLVAFLRLYAQANWRWSLLLPAAACAFIYVLLTQVFRMRLHTGFVTDFLMDRLSG